jgi:hypothetical protein
VTEVAITGREFMSTEALYDTLRSFKDIHKVVLGLAKDLSDEQLNWKPEGFNTSIGFHLWHLARESDSLKAKILYHNPQFVPEFGDGKEIWEKEGLAQLKSPSLPKRSTHDRLLSSFVWRRTSSEP